MVAKEVEYRPISAGHLFWGITHDQSNHHFETLLDKLRKAEVMSLAVDESTDNSDVAQVRRCNVFMVNVIVRICLD